MSIKRVIIGKISDRSGLVKFANGLIEHEIEILTYVADTATYLKRSKVPFNNTTNLLLPDHLSSRSSDCQCDLLIVNLPDIEAIINKRGNTPQQIVEQIDIDTINAIRVAAKNYDVILPIITHNDYEQVISDIQLGKFDDVKYRSRYAQKAFGYTSRYDSIISQFMFLNSI